ncbi:head-tail adaptor protein [Streptomyces sp. NPDC101455]|uniref:phage head completion protein n=1 Tax=Streptomyces sp. NPDC101455 TaxID=3366142 RepID=UPI003804A069
MTGPITHLLNRTLEVWRPVSSPDGYGGQTIALALQPAPVAAKVDQPSASERLVAAQMRSDHSHDIYLQPSADVRRGDELRDADTGEQWRVLAVVAPSTPVYRKAQAQLIQGSGEPDG